MVEQGLDYYLCHDPNNVFYLTNFANFVHERPFILLVPASGKMTFLIPKLEEPHVRVRSMGEMKFLHYFEFPAPKGQQWSDRLQEVLLPNHCVGVESLCPLSVFQAVPGSPVASDIVDEVRMVKSEYKIGRIAYTSQLVSEGHALLLTGARPGRMIIVSYAEISSAMTQKMLEDNPNTNMLNSSFFRASQPPHVSHDPHNFSDIFMKQVEGGPHVSIVSGTANGYGPKWSAHSF